MTRTEQTIPAHQPRSLPAKLAAFLVAGIPMFMLAVPLNWFLVSVVGLPKSGTYALVLVVQSSVNFFICRWFVFREHRTRPLMDGFVPFVSGLLVFRAADWAVYTLLVSYLGLWYLGVQIANAFVFSLLKFGFANRVMGSRRQT